MYCNGCEPAKDIVLLTGMYIVMAVALQRKSTSHRYVYCNGCGPAEGRVFLTGMYIVLAVDLQKGEYFSQVCIL